MRPSPPDRDLVGHARHERQQDDAREQHERRASHTRKRKLVCPGSHRHEGVHHDGHEHRHDEERRAAAHVQAREPCRVGRRKRQAVLEAVDGEVLGPVVAKDARHLGHAADSPDVGHEDDDAQRRLHHVPGDGIARGVLAHQQVGDGNGYRHEQYDAKRHARHHREHREDGLRVMAVGGVRVGRIRVDRVPGVALCVIGVVGRDDHGLVGEDHRLEERYAAAHDGHAAPHGRMVRPGNLVLLEVDAAARLAHGNGPAQPSAHHHALGERRAPDVCAEQLALLGDALVPRPCHRLRPPVPVRRARLSIMGTLLQRQSAQDRRSHAQEA